MRQTCMRAFHGSVQIVNKTMFHFDIDVFLPSPEVCWKKKEPNLQPKSFSILSWCQSILLLHQTIFLLSQIILLCSKTFSHGMWQFSKPFSCGTTTFSPWVKSFSQVAILQAMAKWKCFFYHADAMIFGVLIENHWFCYKKVVNLLLSTLVVGRQVLNTHGTYMDKQSLNY